MPGHRNRKDLTTPGPAAPGGSRPRRLLTVCKGNHCRAPMAAVVLAHRGGLDVEVRSAGIREWHVGRPAHPAMIAAAAHHGYDLTAHRGLKITPALIDWADTVLAMDRAVLAALADLTTQDQHYKLRLYLDGQDVPDPWQQPDDAFTDCVRTIENGALLHITHA